MAATYLGIERSVGKLMGHKHTQTLSAILRYFKSVYVLLRRCVP